MSDISVIDAARELMSRRAARNNFEQYIRYVRPDFIHSTFSRSVCEAIDKFVIDVEAGKRPVIVFSAPPQHGKLCAHDTVVLTTRGWTTHGELAVGDEVFAPDGTPTQVVACSTDGVADMLVELTDGSVVQCHSKHEWTTWNRDKDRYETHETRAMLGREMAGGSRYRFQLPNVSPLTGAYAELPVEPYAQRRVAVKSVTVASEPKKGKCIQVDRPDGLYLVGSALIPTHNSELVSRTLPAYLLGRDPNLYVGAASYSAELAGTMLRSVRGLLDSDAHLRVFPLRSASDTRKRIDRAGEFDAPGGSGKYIGVGVGGGLTGRPISIALVDDAIKNAKEALSPTTKESVWNWYTTVVNTRLSKRSGTIIMATAWSEDDLPRRVIRSLAGSERLTVLSFPAINENGEALVPELKPIEQLLEIKSVSSEFWWSALYQQSPRPEDGAVFLEKGLSYYYPKDLPAKFEKIVASWDCTFKDTDGSDYVVGQVWGRKGDDAYLLHQKRARMTFTATLDAIRAVDAMFPNIQQTLIEDKANGPAVIDTLKAHMRRIVPVEPDGSKLARAHAVTARWEDRSIHIPHPEICEYAKDLVSELLSFPLAAHDDQVDAMTQAIRHLFPLRGKLAISDAAFSRFRG